MWRLHCAKLAILGCAGQEIGYGCFTHLIRHATSHVFNKMPLTKPHPSPFGTRENLICAVAAAKTAVEMARQVRVGLKETCTIELRLDWLKSDAERRRQSSLNSIVQVSFR